MNLQAIPSNKLFAALRAVLARKGIASDDAVRQCRGVMDAAAPAQGGRMVARAWVDPGYRERLLADGTKAAEELGIFLPAVPPISVVENKPGVHYLIVCTLCSCYPRALLGYPPYWYKTSSFRARAVRDPRGLLRDEWGTHLPPTTKLRVIDSTADHRWMVLPERPAGTDGWSEDRLAKLVRDTDLVGVTVVPPVQD